MIRILHTIDTTGPGGAETIFLSLISRIDRSVYEPVVVIRGPGWVSDELAKININPIYINSKGSFNLKYLLNLIRVTRKYKINIIQSHLFGANLYCSIVGLLCNIPVVSTFHGFVDVKDSPILTSIKAKIINAGSRRIVTVSDKLREYFIINKGFSALKSVVIYNGIDTSLFKPLEDGSLRLKLGLRQDDILVGSVGNIRQSKGYEYLLEAARVVVDHNPHYRFIVAGQGDGILYDKLLSLRNKLGLEKYFTFTGYDADVVCFLNNLDIFVLPSVSEGFSISTIEAMASGVPVVVTCSGGPEEIIENDITGVVVPAADCQSLAKAIIEIRNKNNNDCLVDAARKICTSKFSIDAMVASYQSLYAEILSR